jgi:hypothetical protein
MDLVFAMDAIYTNLVDPSWWFTGIFFVVVALALPAIFRAVQRLLKSLSRNRRAKRLWRVKRIRRNPLSISYEISKASANYVLFVLAAFGYLFALVFTPLHEIAKSSTSLVFFIGSPIFVFELMWLFADSFVKEIIRSRERIVKY